MHSAFHYLLHFITNFGDSGLLIVMSFLTSLYLYLAGSHRAALALTGAMLGCLAIMTTLKIGFRSCYQLAPSLNIVSPSGHAAMSAAIMGTLAAIFASHFTGWRKGLPLCAALLMVFGISISRILLGYHTVPEVLVGLAIGTLFAVASYLFLQQAPKVPFKVRYLALTAAVATIFLYGAQTPAEDFLIRLAELLKQTFHICT